jgi:hypothetical protein
LCVVFNNMGMQMLRFIMHIFALVAASGAADAQQARDRLDGFNGVPFGTTFEGWTTATLSALSAPELGDALETAWRHALPKKPKPRAPR